MQKDLPKAVRRMLRYMQALVKVMVRDVRVWIALVVCQAMLIAPFITATPTWGDHLGQEFLRENRLVSAEDAWRMGYPGASEQELANFEQRLETLRAACAADDDRTYFELCVDLAEQDLRDVKNHTLIGPTQFEAESKLAFFQHLAALDNPKIYLNYREAPTWFYLAANHASMPLLAWLAPGMVAAAVVMGATRGRRLLAQAPIGVYKARAAQMIVVLASSIVLMLLVAVPSIIATAVANGWGELAYPVTNTTRTQVLDYTVAIVLVRAFCLYICASLFTTAAIFALAELLPRAWTPAAVIVVALMCAYPLVTDYMELQQAWTGQVDMPMSVDFNLRGQADLSLYNPMTYLREGAEVAGYANYYPHVEQTVDVRLSVGSGVAVFALGAAACTACGGAVLWARRRRIRRMDKGVEAGGPASRQGLVAVGVTVAHGKRVLMRNSELRVAPGEVIGLVAPNGYGKTTLIEALVGANGARHAGWVDMDGASPTRCDAFFKDVLYVPCDAKLLYGNLTPAAHIAIASKLWPHRVDVNKLVKCCGIEGYLHKPVRFCSSGMRQQIALAVAYCTGARYLLLDEPMNALDPGNVALNSRILERLASQGHGVLLSSHILSNLDDVCTSVVFIEDGKLVRHAGNVGEDIGKLYDAVYGAAEAPIAAKVPDAAERGGGI